MEGNNFSLFKNGHILNNHICLHEYLVGFYNHEVSWKTPKTLSYSSLAKNRFPFAMSPSPPSLCGNKSLQFVFSGKLIVIERPRVWDYIRHFYSEPVGSTQWILLQSILDTRDAVGTLNFQYCCNPSLKVGMLSSHHLYSIHSELLQSILDTIGMLPIRLHILYTFGIVEIYFW